MNARAHDLLIGVSGCGGGSRGPRRNFYKRLQYHLASHDHHVAVIPMETIPDNINDNIERMVQLIQDNSDKYRNIYLMGWSMGGAVAVLSAYKMNTERSTCPVKGLILLATQSEGTQPLQVLNIPVLFCHGDADDTVPLWMLEGTYQKYHNRKRILIFQGLDHQFVGPAWTGDEPIRLIAEHAVQVFLHHHHLSSAEGSDSNGDSVTRVMIRAPTISMRQRVTRWCCCSR